MKIRKIYNFRINYLAYDKKFPATISRFFSAVDKKDAIKQFKSTKQLNILGKPAVIHSIDEGNFGEVLPRKQALQKCFDKIMGAK